MPLFGPPNVVNMEARRNTKGLDRALRYQGDARVRSDAAEALGRIGDARSIESLITALNETSTDEDLNKALVRALAQIGTPAVEPLIVVLSGQNQNARHGAIEALGEIGDTRAVEPLIAALKDPTLNTGSLASALGKMGDPRAVEPLIATLADENGYVRATAARALAQLGDTRAVEPLIAALSDKDWNARDAVAEALGQIGDARAAKPLVLALRDQVWESMHRAASRALRQIGEPAVESLVAALRDQEAHVRQSAAGVLADLGWWPGASADGAYYLIARNQWARCVRIGQPAVEPLLAALGDGDKSVCEAAARALGEIGDARAVDSLVAALTDPYVSVYRAAMEALAMIGEPATDSLVVALKSPDHQKRWKAGQVLDKLGWQPPDSVTEVFYWMAHGEWSLCVEIGQPAVEPLIVALKDRDETVRSAAAEALGEIGDARAVEPLVQAFSRGNRAVAMALKRLDWKPPTGEQEAAFWITLGEYSRCVALGEAAVKPLITDLGTGNSRAASALAEIGAPAVGPLILRLQDGNISVARAAARVLVSMYQSGHLDAGQKQRILAQRSTITSHIDQAHHVDLGDVDCVGTHTDSGLAVDFAL